MPMKSVEHLTDDELGRQLVRAAQALPDAPESWQQAVIGLWSAQAAAQGSQSERAASVAKALVRAVLATLTFDSWATTGVALGMRSARNPTRHLLYSAQGRDVDLRITPGAEHFTISGQIFGPDESGRVELSALAAGSGISHTGELDPMSEFRLDQVPAGRYVLTLHLGTQPIVVQPIEVGEPAA